MRRTKYKLKGVLLITTIVAVAAWILLAGGIFLSQSSQFQMLGAQKDEDQAKQYAEVDANLLKLIDYGKLTDESTLADYKLHLDRDQIQTVDAPDWEDEISIGDEQKFQLGGVCRIATINIYHKGDTKPRASVNVPIMKDAQMYSRSQVDDMIKKAMENSAGGKVNVYLIPGIDIGNGRPSFQGIYAFIYYECAKKDKAYSYYTILANNIEPPPPNYFTYNIVDPIYGWPQETDTFNMGIISEWKNSVINSEKVMTALEQIDPDLKFAKLHDGIGNVRIYAYFRSYLNMNPSCRRLGFFHFSSELFDEVTYVGHGNKSNGYRSGGPQPDTTSWCFELYNLDKLPDESVLRQVI